MKVPFLFVLFLCLLAAASPLPAQQVLRGRAVKILDGDTFDLLTAAGTFRIRLNGIDCPEKGQPYSRKATDALGRLCQGQELTVRFRSKDRNGRVLGDVFTPADNWLNLRLVEEGWAWHFKRYSSNRQLAAAETAARRRRAGLWQDRNPIAPWDWRRGKR
ncbi:MAG TPA: thermonuclease family protein [Lacibacter sp.]|nr:thermonuclease family protein [Lacibacter sp.]HMO88270.1 thermonuclease family protein [Lacibacter sp.]HMP87848.1 thermonuclease family protein [Lacibacter sp.]